MQIRYNSIIVFKSLQKLRVTVITDNTVLSYVKQVIELCAELQIYMSHARSHIVLITVTDSGASISPDQRPWCFLPQDGRMGLQFFLL